jgi:RNA polymerase sigma-70 factor (ECF subfamily)
MLMGNANSTQRFYALVWPLTATVLRTATFLTHNATDAEDLAQDAIIKAFKSLDSLQDETRVRPWLLTILRNTHKDRVRLNHHLELSLNQAALEPATHELTEQPDPAEFLEHPDGAMELFSDADMISALRSLPKEIRWTLLLVDIEELEDAEAASILDVPEGTIKSRLHRGRKMLRAALADRAPRTAAAVASPTDAFHDSTPSLDEPAADVRRHEVALV